MDSVNPATLRDVMIILLALVGLVCLIYTTILRARRRPSADVDLAEIKTTLDTVVSNQTDFKDALKFKRSTVDCDRIFEALEKDIGSITDRHSKFEDKISKQIGAVHERITGVFGEMREIAGEVKVALKGNQS